MKVFCIGRNYVEHAHELNNAVPEEPIIFMKPQNAVAYNGSNLSYPYFTNELHYEAELVIKICKNGKNVPRKFAKQYYNAITVGIDYTARDIQAECKRKGLPWEKAKAFNGSAFVGDFQKIDFSQHYSFALTKNGETVQQGNSRDMIFTFDAIIEDIARYFTLNIGDLIFTGTPAGVGECVVTDVLEGFLNGEQVFKTMVY